MSLDNPKGYYSIAAGLIKNNPHIEGGSHIIMCTYCMAVIDRSGQIVGVFFADVPMEDVSQLSVDMHQGIISSRTLLFFIQVGSLLIIGFVVWLSFRAFRRYKDRYVDPEKDHLVEQLAKLREVNTRLVKRNQDLAEKVAKLQNHLKTVSSQSGESHYFG